MEKSFMVCRNCINQVTVEDGTIRCHLVPKPLVKHPGDWCSLGAWKSYHDKYHEWIIWYWGEWLRSDDDIMQVESGHQLKTVYNQTVNSFAANEVEEDHADVPKL